jgi:hypothetical protein
MGGSGGGGGSYFSGDPAKLIQQLRDSERGTRNEAYEADVGEYLSGLLSVFNNRDTEAINARLHSIRGALESELDGTIDLRYGGSVSKHTAVDGLSDVDSLVLLDSCELATRAPGEAKDYLATKLEEHFPDTTVTEGRMAVTIAFPDAEIQLLPAVSCKSAVMIPNADGTEWSQIHPREFSGILTRINQENAGKVVPVIKLAKAINANLPPQQQLSGYHLESLAVEAFRSYGGPKTPKAMLSHLFTESASRVLRPVTDSTGQSVHVDEYLGAADSKERMAVSDAFSRIARRMRLADSSASPDGWRGLFGD